MRPVSKGLGAFLVWWSIGIMEIIEAARFAAGKLHAARSTILCGLVTHVSASMQLCIFSTRTPDNAPMNAVASEPKSGQTIVFAAERATKRTIMLPGATGGFKEPTALESPL